MSSEVCDLLSGEVISSNASLDSFAGNNHLNQTIFLQCNNSKFLVYTYIQPLSGIGTYILSIVSISGVEEGASRK